MTDINVTKLSDEKLEDIVAVHPPNSHLRTEALDELEKRRHAEMTSLLKSTIEAEDSKALSIENVWDRIQKDFDITKRGFGKKFSFVTDAFKREIIFRDIGQAYILAESGFNKPAVILAGGVMEELLRLYLKHKKISQTDDTFNSYIIACDKHDLLKNAISKLTDSFRHFRNLVHLSNEKIARHTISKATAKGAVASIFTLANDF